ncbi:MAG: UbiX family flavin prenyltransferase, partial [Desulfatiglandales bacterium]
VIYGVRMIEVLSELGVETHLIVSQSAIRNLEIETPYREEQLRGMATVSYDVDDVGAAPASGSFPVDGMIIIPCTIKTLSAVANSFNYNLIIRAADVNLKERRRVVLVVRETPFHEGHLELMLKVTRMGGVIMPPVPAFYHMPKTVDDIIDQTIGKALDLFGIDAGLCNRWGVDKESKERTIPRIAKV